MGNGFHASGSHGYDHASGLSKTGERLGDAASKTGEAMQDAFGSVRHAAESAGSAVSDTAHKIGETASSAYQTASSKSEPVGRGVGELRHRSRAKDDDEPHAILSLRRRTSLWCWSGSGLALGAVLGAAFPTTDLENRVMGDTADDVKRDAKQGSVGATR